jgi:hypothetical protein
MEPAFLRSDCCHRRPGETKREKVNENSSEREKVNEKSSEREKKK